MSAGDSEAVSNEANVVRIYASHLVLILSS